jgi:hypothetical protein
LTYFLAAIETITVAPGSAWSKAFAKIARSPGLAATIQVTAASSGIAPVSKTGRRQDAAQKNSRQGPWMALPA